MDKILKEIGETVVHEELIKARRQSLIKYALEKLSEQNSAEAAKAGKTAQTTSKEDRDDSEFAGSPV